MRKRLYAVGEDNYGTNFYNRMSWRRIASDFIEDKIVKRWYELRFGNPGPRRHRETYIPNEWKY